MKYNKIKFCWYSVMETDFHLLKTLYVDFLNVIRSYFQLYFYSYKI